MPDATAAPPPSGAFDFDALLAPNLGPPGATPSPVAKAPSSGLATATVGQEAPPSWHDFAASWPLYRDPIVCGVVAGAVLGVLGVFVVLRRAVFVTAAVSQSAALGVALAFLLGIYSDFTPPPMLCAFALALMSSALLASRPRAGSLPREASVGLLYVGASALAVLVGDRIAQESEDITAILFGTAVLVRPEDLLAVLVVSGLVGLTITVLYRGLVFAGFDPEGARVHGLPVVGLELALWVLVALEVSVATRAIGALPVFAFSVLPAMTALLAVKRLTYVLPLAGLLGALSAGLGYLAAFFLRFPVGAAEACVGAIFFVAAALAARFRPST